MRLIAFLMLVGFSTLANAYDLVSEVRFLDPNPVLSGTVNRVEVTVSNIGQTHAIDVSGGTAYEIGFGQSTVAVIPVQETPPCAVRYSTLSPPPGEPTFYIAAIVPDANNDVDLAPGESFSCIVGITTFPESPQVVRQAFDTAPFLDDENPDNNTSFLNVITGNGSTAIPSLNLWGIAVLVLMTVLVAFRAMVVREN